MQAFGGERRVQGLGDAFSGGGRVEGGLAVAEVEGEGVGPEGAVGAHHDRALEAEVAGGLFQGGLQGLGESPDRS